MADLDTANNAQPVTIERHSIDYIPAEDRHGSPFSLFTLWFSGNMQITTVVTGALAVALGLSLGWAIVAIVIGNLLGGIFMALHSAQGPKMGVPQMIQSRAQFGFYGALVPLILVIIMYIGFFASSAILGGQALTAWTGMPINLAIVIVALICMMLAIYGYDIIHRYEGIVSILFALGFIYLTIRVLITSASAHMPPAPAFSVGTFLLVVSIIATWQITYGPYVADYSRYLPENTSTATTFLWTYGGSVISSIWMMILGCLAVSVAAKAFNADSVQYIVTQAGGGLGWLFYLIIILGIIAANVLNLYGIFLTTTTAASLPMLRSVSARVWLIIGATVVGTAVAVLGQGNFINNYTNFLLFLLYFIIPWSAINLIDFYLLRHERYHITAIFDPNGIYGRFNWRTLLAYVITIIIEIPFMNSTIYTGPLVAPLGGADITWIVGLIVSSVAYYLLMRSQTAFQSKKAKESAR